jgi:hypothetical protein
MNKTPNLEVIVTVEAEGAEELLAIRTALTTTIDKYKGAWHYRRRVRIFDAAYAIDPVNTQMHPRMINVEDLENIVANPALNATQLIAAVETYLNTGNHFSWAKESPLRKGLNAQAKKQRKQHNLALVDLYLSLMVGAPPVALPVVAGADDPAVVAPIIPVAPGVLAAMAAPDDADAPPPPVPPRDDEAMEDAQAARAPDFARLAAEQQAQVAGLQQRLDAANAELVGAQASIANLQQNIAQKDVVLNQAQRAVKQKTGEVRQLNARLETQQQIIAQQRSTINAQKTMLQSLSAKIETLSNSANEFITSLFKTLEQTSADLIMATFGRKIEEVKKIGASKPEIKKEKGFSPFKGLTKEGRAEKAVEKRRKEAEQLATEQAIQFRIDIKAQFEKGEGPTYQRVVNLSDVIEDKGAEFFKSDKEIAKALREALNSDESDADDTAAPPTSSLVDSDGDISTILESFEEPASPAVRRSPMHVPAAISAVPKQVNSGIAIAPPPPPVPAFNEQKANRGATLSNSSQSILPQLGKVIHSINSSPAEVLSSPAAEPAQGDSKSGLHSAINSVRLKKAVIPAKTPVKEEATLTLADMLASSMALRRGATYHASDDEAHSDAEAARNGW